MSGAEFIAVIGIGASIIQLSDACHKVLVRIRQYRGHSAFLELASQIRLFSKDVEALQDPRALAALDPDLEADVIDLLKGCRKRIQELETLIEAQIPNPDSSSFKRVANAVRSLAKDRKLKEILDELAIYQRIVTLHLARATWKNQQDILQVLSSLERATSNVHQPTPSLTSAKQFAINEFPSSPTPRKSSRQPLCALGTCGCPCHNETTRLRLLGFAAPSLHVLQCRCTQADISLDISALQRLLRFNIMLS
ncbi:uncharacterized protein J3D65DRAFT_417041 [Phyllosticta citribraziliensis]|uniref:NACHT-NTPase and P-loop NTPases N-terminal domain-containing protein n=1 Tax=Phyllosticta citribraziliensis TaxID=989973 RepID=A0ABR1LNR7_9PEZI